MAKPTITDSASNVLTLEHPDVGVVRRNLWDKVSARTKNGTAFERINYRKYIYELNFKNMDRTKYDEIDAFLVSALNAGRTLTFNYTDRWATANGIQVLVALGDDNSQGGTITSSSVIIEEVVKR
ncbi:MAG: hypothetical protein M0R80_18305 [Proteobacteria bacterium]|jgi:hypothetical protein|nr:hypothetical protein [Pseudomonadota bacterium]